MENDILYNVVDAINFSPEHFQSLDLSSVLLKSYRLKKRNKAEKSSTEIREISGETFGKIIEILKKHDKKFDDNLDAKGDYSHYSCYVSSNGLSGFCINLDTKEFCNFYSVQKGLGNKIFSYALENYDCLGINNALPETYDNYYQSKFDMITHHWEENWDFPGDKNKAVWFGYILPKGTLSEQDRVAVLREGQRLKEKAFSKEDVEQKVSTFTNGKTDKKWELSNDELETFNRRLDMTSEETENILASALSRCYGVIKKNQINSAWRESTYSPELVTKQMSEIWQKRSN